ncbi:hypothetical protein [Pseudoalteromonas sp. CO325X]|nr:hypothetical protein [Pseudoalteromonas sp. CO325X]
MRIPLSSKNKVGKVSSTTSKNTLKTKATNKVLLTNKFTAERGGRDRIS